MPLQFHYLAPVRLPTEKAHGLQIVHNCEALAAAGAAVTLYAATRFQPPELRGRDIWTVYDVPRDAFRLRYVPTLDLLPLAGGRINRFTQAAHYLQLATYSAALWLLLRSTAADAVYYSRHPLVLDALRRFKPSRRLFWEVHSLSADRRKRQAQADLARAIGGALTVTRHMADMLVELGVPAERVLVVPDGIRAERFAAMPGQAEARAALGLPPEAFIIGYMGRLHTLNMGKGVDDLILAIARQPERALHLLLVGGPEEMAAAYRVQWVALGLPPERFHAPGQIAAAEVPRALAAFDVAVMPFPWTEHFAYYASPVKLFEYMASGRPIVATDLPSTAEIVRHEETALLVPPSDVDALAAALARLQDDPPLRTCLAENARRLVFERYTWAARAAQILDFVQRR
ncbi:MAG: glycosyltransferase [Anaerolineae bacterium]|nr:glycosyltransferase [Anaerolineae bacterium]